MSATKMDLWNFKRDYGESAKMWVGFIKEAAEVTDGIVRVQEDVLTGFINDIIADAKSSGEE